MDRFSPKTPNIYTSFNPDNKEQFDNEMQKGMDDIDNNRVFSVDFVEDEMKKLYGK